MHLDLKTTVRELSIVIMSQTWSTLAILIHEVIAALFTCILFLKLLQIMVLIRLLLHVRNPWPPWDGLIWISTSSTGLELREGREKILRMFFWERKAGEHWSSYTVKVYLAATWYEHLILVCMYLGYRESKGNRSVQLYSEALGRIANICHN